MLCDPNILAFCPPVQGEHASSTGLLLTYVWPLHSQQLSHQPMLIDAVQQLLQSSGAYASLVEHPEMAPSIRALRRLVGAPFDRGPQQLFFACSCVYCDGRILI